MTSYVYRTRGRLQVSRYWSTLIARTQASQSTSNQSGQQGGSSVLPKSTTSKDKTNPTKTSSDAPPLDHENVDIKNKAKSSESRTSSSSGDSKQQAFAKSSSGKLFTIALLTVGIYISYRMISGGRITDRITGDKGLHANEHYKRATADYQSANTQGTDVKK